MDADVQQLVTAIHDSSTLAVLATAGAGGQALADLLGVPGASRTLLEALVPYAAASFDQFLGRTPEQYVSAETAQLLAGRALNRARRLTVEDRPLVGLACTATIVTDRPKKGEHRAHVAAWMPARLARYSLTLEKGARDRPGEDALVSRLILNTLAEACGLAGALPLRLGAGDRLELYGEDYAATAGRLASGDIPYFGILDFGRLRFTDAHPQVVLSGSFNPLHEGHLGLAQAAADVLGKPVAFEISAANVDKPPLERPILLDRLSQFAGLRPVFASNAATFIEKARLYPGATFVVGHDTAVRIVHPRYYGDSYEAMLSALAEIRSLGCSFLVAGRVDETGEFLELDDLSLPDGFADLFRAIPAGRFRRDISSTEIRTGRQAHG